MEIHPMDVEVLHVKPKASTCLWRYRKILPSKIVVEIFHKPYCFN